MLLQIHPLQMEQTELLKAFIVPEVWEMPERDRFWHLAALAEDGKIVGGIVVDPKESGAELMSIAVSPDYYRLGVATELLDYTKEMLLSAGVEMLYMSMSLPLEGWSGLAQFLERNEFILSEQERYTYHADLKDIAQHPLLGTMPLSNHVASVKELTDRELQNLRLCLPEMNVDPAVIKECNPSLSFVWRGKNRIEAIFLMSNLQDGVIYNLWTWLSQKANNSKALIELFAAVAQKAVKEYPLETILAFACLDESSDRLIHYFLPKMKPILSLRAYISSTMKVNHGKEGMADVKEEGIEKSIKPDRSGYWADMAPNIVEESSLVCTSCQYCMGGTLLECEKYERKPGCVFYGMPCDFYKKES